MVSFRLIALFAATTCSFEAFAQSTSTTTRSNIATPRPDTGSLIRGSVKRLTFDRPDRSAEGRLPPVSPNHKVSGRPESSDSESTGDSVGSVPAPKRLKSIKAPDLGRLTLAGEDPSIGPQALDHEEVGESQPNQVSSPHPKSTRRPSPRRYVLPNQHGRA